MASPDLATAVDPLVPTGFRQWFGRLFGVLARSGPALVVVQLVALVPVLLFGAVVTAGPAAAATPVVVVPAMLLCSAAWVLAQAAAVHMAIRQAAGRGVAVDALVRAVATRALSILGSTAVALVVGVAAAVTGIGGIYASLVFVGAFAGVVVVERAGIRRAFALVNVALWPTAARLLLLKGAAFGYLLVVILVLLPDGPQSFAGAVAYTVLTLPPTLVFLAAAVVTYAELRHHENPAVSTMSLAAELER
ncbi:hypothetical protein [Pseudonocardia nigra]|uniref:hypothetical protein n=1 Tax=Pseudonocardia nigra TaxID=1921578 RepID=UPI001C5D127A|nr:hypothetical protein [Pseudonocardia nigra]